MARATKNDHTEAFSVGLQATVAADTIYMIPAVIYHNLQIIQILLILLGLAYGQEHFKKVTNKGYAVKSIAPVAWVPFPVNHLNRQWMAYSEVPENAVRDGIEVFYTPGT